MQVFEKKTDKDFCIHR